MDRIPLYDKSECESWIAVIDNLREFWVHRRLHHPFYTLGAASYLDASAKRGKVAYEDERARSTPILKKEFAPILDKVATSLAAATGIPARYDDTHYALPGFHIYGAHPDFAGTVAKIHCDRQYEGLDWSPHGIEPAERRNLSFTLSLMLPSGGSGIYFWPVTHKENLIDRELSKKSFTSEHREYHPYVEGEMVIHSGDLVHQAIIQCDPAATGRRITLQGHAVELDNEWLLYW